MFAAIRINFDALHDEDIRNAEAGMGKRNQTFSQAFFAATSCHGGIEVFGSRNTEIMPEEGQDRYCRDLFLVASEPQAAAALWACLSPSDRSALQAAHWWLHSDLRWFLFGIEAVYDSDNNGNGSPKEEGELPRRAG